MLSVEEARQRIISKFHILDKEYSSILDSLGQVIAEDIYSKVSVPPLDNSAMDGFAVRSVETNGANEDNPVRLEVRGCILAGELAPAIDQKESCCEIMTGSVMPTGFDAVIPVEQVEITNEGGRAFILINQSVQSGRNVRFSGADFKPGQVIAKKGQLLNPHILMAINARIPRELFHT